MREQATACGCRTERGGPTVSPVFRHGGLRLYLLKLLDEAPRHGYDVIRLLQDRFLGVYSPSPGTIYPRLARLEEEGLVTHEVIDGKKVYKITDAGRAELSRRLDDLADLEDELAASVRDIAMEALARRAGDGQEPAGRADLGSARGRPSWARPRQPLPYRSANASRSANQAEAQAKPKHRRKPGQLRTRGRDWRSKPRAEAGRSHRPRRPRPGMLRQTPGAKQQASLLATTTTPDSAHSGHDLQTSNPAAPSGARQSATTSPAVRRPPRPWQPSRATSHQETGGTGPPEGEWRDWAARGEWRDWADWAELRDWAGKQEWTEWARAQRQEWKERVQCRTAGPEGQVWLRAAGQESSTSAPTWHGSVRERFARPPECRRPTFSVTWSGWLPPSPGKSAAWSGTPSQSGRTPSPISAGS